MTDGRIDVIINNANLVPLVPPPLPFFLRRRSQDRTGLTSFTRRLTTLCG
jgi:hypothetical protein